jgi:hypothetical protein
MRFSFIFKQNKKKLAKHKEIKTLEKEINQEEFSSIRHNLIVPSSEHDANKPASFGLNDMQLTSWE